MSKMAEEKAAGAADAVQQQQLVVGEAATVWVRPMEKLLRVAPLGLCVVAMVVAYSDLGGFKYLIYANGLCAAF